MNANLFLSTTHNGIVRAARGSDGGWQVDFLLSGQDVRCFAADPLNPGVIYAGTQGDGVIRSADSGKTWRPAGLEGKIVKSLAVSPLENGTIYAGIKPALVFVSRDSGATWTELDSFRRIPWRWWWFSPAETPFSAYVQAIALSPTDPRTILIGVELGAVVRSTDGGETWSRHRKRAIRDCHSLTFHPTDGNWVYEAGGGGAAVSQDGGDSWRRPKKGLDRKYGWACAGHPGNPEIWYASASPGPSKAHGGVNALAYVFRTSGNGIWHKLSGGLTQPLPMMVYALLTDRRDPDYVYAGTSNGDVWHSTNQGDTWAKLPFDLKGIHRSLIML